MSTIIVNGRRIDLPNGRNISVVNNRVFVDGKEVTDSALSGIVEIKWEGPLANLECAASVSCGDVGGSVRASGSVNAGDVGGDVKAGGSVNCGRVDGSVKAGGSVCHG